MILIGIDPGLDGAMFQRDLSDNTYTFYDTPTLEIKTGKKKRREYNIAMMAQMLKQSLALDCDDKSVVVALEKIHSMPGQGVRSMFCMGEGFGIWKGLITGLGYQMHLITPQAWKKDMMNGMGKEKDASRLRALQLYPQFAEELKLKKHHGRADALLLADYLKKSLQGGNMTESKTCKTCNKEHPLSQYYKHNDTSDGLRHSCKGCHSVSQMGRKENTNKVFCKRGEGSEIRQSNCFPGNDACQTCPHPNEKNRMSHTLTKEEEDMDKFTINTGGGYGVSQGSLA